MIYQKHCPGCFVSKSGLAVCPVCGYDESAQRSPLYLPHGIVVGGQFRVGRILGQPGGFGISYLAWDVHLQQRVAIKEYLPRALAIRAPDAQDVVAQAAEYEKPFLEGLEHFLYEARVIARLDHPNVVRVRSFFRANRTAYLVMDYYEGVSLGDYLNALADGRVDPKTAATLLGPVLKGLEFLHERGVVHRDIKPQNIYLATGGRTILLDFGSARQFTSNAPNGMAVVLSEGYAPLEQYQRDSEQGPASDVYGVAATLYRMAFGSAPPAALDRMGSDPLTQDFGSGLPRFEAVLRKALALHAVDRYQSAAAFHEALHSALDISEVSAEPDLRAHHSESDTAPFVRSVWPRQSQLLKGRQGPEIIAGAVLIGAAMIALTLWLRLP